MKKLLSILLISLFMTKNSNAAETELEKALIHSTKFGQIEKVQKILSSGQIRNIFIYRALIDAADVGNALSENNYEIIELLIKNNADVNWHGYSEEFTYRETALICAVRKRKTKVVELLLNAGANPNIAGPETLEHKNGETPLMIAKANNFQEIVKMLKEKGAKDNSCCVIL